MSVSSQSSIAKNSANSSYFFTSFVHKAHEVLKLGYDRLDSTSFSSSDEEHITGELTKEMQAALEDPRAPRWCRYFWANEETRVNIGKRYGKNRQRIDIEITKHQKGKRPKLRFEAKRLSRNHSVNGYLGTSGLGCFLDGSYAVEDTVVGMLGYIQDSDVTTFSTAIEAEINLHVDTIQKWQAKGIARNLDTFQSCHKRKNALPSVKVIHTLLAFC